METLVGWMEPCWDGLVLLHFCDGCRLLFSGAPAPYRLLNITSNTAVSLLQSSHRPPLASHFCCPIPSHPSRQVGSAA